jgi:RimJ/RimL family protein N-acetyltransferase
MDVVIETDRLLFRRFTEDDAPLLYDLNLDPEVIRYTYDPLTDVEHARKVIKDVILPQ